MSIEEDYLLELCSIRDLSPAAERSRRSAINTLKRMHGDEPYTTPSIIRLVRAIKGAEYKPNYKVNLMITLKNFARWLAAEGYPIDLKKIDPIKLPEGQWKCKSSGDMISQDEVMQAIRACRTSRNRAFVAMLYDGSHRPVELCRLDWGDLNTEEGISYVTNAKTGNIRTIALTMSIPYLMRWMDDYPGDPEGKNPIFVSDFKPHKRLGRHGVEYMFKDLVERTGNPKLKPGTLRPSRITHDVAAGFDVSYIMLKNWGSLKTPMIDKYTNLSGQYIIDYARDAAGMEKVKKKRPEIIKPITCPACSTLNVPMARFCCQCMAPLSEEARRQYDLMQQLKADPDALEGYARYLREKRVESK